MQRYKEGTWFMQKDDDGDYVLHSDALQKRIAALETDNANMARLNNMFPLEIARLEDENEILKQNIQMHWKRHEEMKDKLSRLTAALKDNERAEKVAKSTPGYWSIRGRAINGYRAEILKEVEGCEK